MNSVLAPRRSERGQVLVIVAGGLVVIVAMVGLVIDGGFAWGRQRDTQNGADAAAKAGTVVVQHYIAGFDNPWPTPNDYAVACAVAASATATGVVVEEAEYVDFAGESLLPNPVLVGDCTADLGVAIPPGAQGVRARVSETFDTFLMAVIGVPTLTAVADAIAVVGTLQTITGGALPVTFPQTSEVCDSLGTPFTVQLDDKDATWEPYEILSSEAAADSSNLAIVPLCDTGPGSVGWLDWDCGQRLAESIEEPCPITILIPSWVHTQTGNVNNLEDELNSYAGNVVGTPEAEDSVLALPIHDFTCDEDLLDGPEPDGDPITACPSYDTWSGMGNNLWYHAPFWIGFKLDHAYTQGGDVECQSGPGSPVMVPPLPPGVGQGFPGCLKGWFVAHYPAPGSVGIGPIDPGEVQNLAVTLIN
jgi:hypothetical protein